MAFSYLNKDLSELINSRSFHVWRPNVFNIQIIKKTLWNNGMNKKRQ